MLKTFNLNHTIKTLQSGLKVYKRPGMYQFFDFIIEAIECGLIDIDDLKREIEKTRAAELYDAEREFIRQMTEAGETCEN